MCVEMLLIYLACIHMHAMCAHADLGMHTPKNQKLDIALRKPENSVRRRRHAERTKASHSTELKQVSTLN